MSHISHPIEQNDDAVAIAMKLLHSALYFLAGLASGIAIALTGSSSSSSGERRTSTSATSATGPAEPEMKMVLVVNSSLKMGKGKIVAQGAHAACGCVENAEKSAAGRRRLVAWRRQGQKKIALSTTQDDLLRLERSLRSAGINCCLIADAGKTHTHIYNTHIYKHITPSLYCWRFGTVGLHDSTTRRLE